MGGACACVCVRACVCVCVCTCGVVGRASNLSAVETSGTPGSRNFLGQGMHSQLPLSTQKYR